LHFLQDLSVAAAAAVRPASYADATNSPLTRLEASGDL
jgi:hypothetical protein